MKRYLYPAIQFCAALLLMILVSGCLKDHCTYTYTIYKPYYKTLSQVRAAMVSGPARPLERTGKIYIYGNYIFLNELDKGIHIIDNSQPSNPVNVSFINIPGNVDLAVNGHTLYADAYEDLVAFDISSPTNVTAKKFVTNVFPNRSSYYHYGTSTDPDSVLVIAGWTAKDTTVSCDVYSYYYRNYYSLANADAGGNYSSPNVGGGTGGSMARFALLDQHLFTVSNSDLSVFDVGNALSPEFINKTKLGAWNIETIFPMRDKLFIGSNNGMLIYDVSSPASPEKLSQFAHVRSCDPVIADNKYAYVTLRSGAVCQGFNNQLDVINIENLLAPSLVKSYSFTNPHGLSKQDNLMFICDGKDGLKIMDATDVNDIKLVKQITGLDTYDVIARNNIALVVAKDGLYQFDYANKTNIKLLSKIGLAQ